MNPRPLVTPLLLTLLVLASPLPGCAVDASPTASAAPTQAFRGADDEPAISAELELLRDGLSAVALDPALAALAHERILLAAKVGEYEVSLAELAEAAADLDLDLGGQIQAGVIARGGSDADATHALELIDGFVSEGVAVTPTLYVPHLDLAYFGLDAWETPTLFTTTRSLADDGIVAIEAGGPELVLDLGALSTTPSWFASYRVLDGEDPDPSRLLARCYCVQTNPGSGGTVGVTCETYGSATTQGSCGRTGLFSGDCHRVCGGASGT